MKISLNLFFYSQTLLKISHSVISGGTEGGRVNHAACSHHSISDEKSKLKADNLLIPVAKYQANSAAFVPLTPMQLNGECPKAAARSSASLLVCPQRPLRRTVKALHPPTLPTRRQTPPLCCSIAGVTTWALRAGGLRSRSSVTMATTAILATGSPSPDQFQICDQTGRSS